MDHPCPKSVIHRKVAKDAKKKYFPLRRWQNKSIAIQKISAAGLKLFDFRPLTGNQKKSQRSLCLE
jgi:hypothetical protein